MPYLSRLCLNPYSAEALRFFADPYEIHRQLLQVLPAKGSGKPSTGEQPKTAELLFRPEQTPVGPVVLMQTISPPDWASWEFGDRFLSRDPETKHYDPTFTVGQRLSFRLLCQPTERKALATTLRDDGKRLRGPRIALRADEDRLAWLKRKGEASGFRIETAGITYQPWVNSKPLQDKGGAPKESRDETMRRIAAATRQPRKAKHPSTRLGAIRFDGAVQVTDPDALLQAVLQGIGTQKAFGFGLLSLAPA